MMRKFLLAVSALTFTVTAIVTAGTATRAVAQGYPNKAVTIVMPYAAGGNGDILTRFIADAAKTMWNVPVVVDNRPGAGGAIGIGQVARAAPDGYTVVFVSTSPMTVAPHLAKQTYDALKDFTYLERFGIGSQPMMVRADSPFKTMKDVVEYARANPGKFRWTSAAQRGGPQLATEALFKAEGVQTTYVTFQGDPESMSAVLGGKIEAAVMATYTEQLKAGTIRLIAEAGPYGIDGLPNVPTYKSLGYKLAPVVFIGLAGPAGLPAEVVAKWDDTIGKIVASQAYIDLSNRLNTKVSFAGSKEFTQQVKDDYEALGVAIKDLGLAQQ